MCARRPLVEYDYLFRLHISACSHHCEIRRHFRCIGLAKVLDFWWSMCVLLVSTRDRVRACGVADLVFFSVKDPALHRVHASWAFANGLRFARIRVITHMLMHECLDGNKTRSYRASSSVSLTESPQNPYRRKHKSVGLWRTQPWLALFLNVIMFRTHWHVFVGLCIHGSPKLDPWMCVHGEHCRGE